MKVLVVCVVALFALAFAEEDHHDDHHMDDHGCTPLERIEVKAQWQRAFGEHRQDFGQAVWRAFFAQAPEARSFFKGVHGDDTNSGEFKAHIARVLGGLDIAINLLDNEPALKAELHHLAVQHKERHVPDHYFDIFRSALGHVLPAQLGRCWDKEAWRHCYDVIADGIREHH